MLLHLAARLRRVVFVGKARCAAIGIAHDTSFMHLDLTASHSGERATIFKLDEPRFAADAIARLN